MAAARRGPRTGADRSLGSDPHDGRPKSQGRRRVVARLTKLSGRAVREPREHGRSCSGGSAPRGFPSSTCPRRGVEGRGVTANCGGHSPPFGGPGPGVLPRLHRAPSSGVRPTDGHGAGRGPTRPLAPCCLCPREVASFVSSSSGWWFIKYAFTCEARREGFIIVMGKPSVKGTIAKALARKAKIFLISIQY